MKTDTLTFLLNKQDHKDLKLKAIKNNTNVSDVLRNFIKEYLKDDKNLSFKAKSKQD